MQRERVRVPGAQAHGKGREAAGGCLSGRQQACACGAWSTTGFGVLLVRLTVFLVLLVITIKVYGTKLKPNPKARFGEKPGSLRPLLPREVPPSPSSLPGGSPAARCSLACASQERHGHARPGARTARGDRCAREGVRLPGDTPGKWRGGGAPHEVRDAPGRSARQSPSEPGSAAQSAKPSARPGGKLTRTGRQNSKPRVRLLARDAVRPPGRPPGKPVRGAESAGPAEPGDGSLLQSWLCEQVNQPEGRGSWHQESQVRAGAGGNAERAQGARAWSEALGGARGSRSPAHVSTGLPRRPGAGSSPLGGRLLSELREHPCSVLQGASSWC